MWHGINSHRHRQTHIHTPTNFGLKLTTAVNILTDYVYFFSTLVSYLSCKEWDTIMNLKMHLSR